MYGIFLYRGICHVHLYTSGKKDHDAEYVSGYVTPIYSLRLLELVWHP